MGAIRFHQDRAEDALPFVKRAAASPAATAEMHCILGAVLYKLGNRNEAIDAYERALAVKPGYTDALNALANIYREEQKSHARRRRRRGRRRSSPNCCAPRPTRNPAITASCRDGTSR